MPAQADRGTAERFIGLISDTHGLIRPDALDAFRGCELILHAGDIGSIDVLEKLRAVAPVVAVRGNTDNNGWAGALPVTELVTIGPLSLYLLHRIADLDIDPAAAGVGAVISGHSHSPSIRTIDNVHYIDPGSAGPPRFRQPVSIGLLRISGALIDPRIIILRS